MNPSTDKNNQAEPISRKRAMAFQALGGYINTGIQIIQGLLLIPLYLHFIGPHLYGLWLASGGVLAMLGVMNLGFGSLLTQRVAKAYGQSDHSKAGECFINGLAVYFTLATIFIGVGLLLSFNLSALIKANETNELLLKQCFQIAVVATGLGFINECLRGFSSALLRALYSSLVLAGSRIIGMAATLVLLYRDVGLWAIPIGMLLTEGLALLLGLIQTALLFRGLGTCWAFNLTLIGEYFRTGGLLFASRLGNALSRDADPLLITLFLQAEVTAAYMVTRRGADIVFQLLAVIYGAAHGAFSHLAGAGDEAKTGSVAAKLLAIVFFVGLVGFSCYVALNSSFVTLWVGETFSLDRGLILLIGLAYFLQSLRNMVLQILNGLGEFDISSRVILLEGLIKTGLTIWLLNWVGISGVSLSLAVACLLALFILGAKLKGCIRLPITVKTYAKSVITAGLLFSVAIVLPSFVMVKLWSNFILLAVACVMAAVLILVLLNWNVFKVRLKARPI